MTQGKIFSYKLVVLLFVTFGLIENTCVANSPDVSSFDFIQIISQNPDHAQRPAINRLLKHERADVLRTISELVFDYHQEIPLSIGWQKMGANGRRILGGSYYAEGTAMGGRRIFNGLFDYHDQVMRYIAYDSSFMKTPMDRLFHTVDTFTTSALRSMGTAGRGLPLDSPILAPVIQTHVDRRGLEALRRFADTPASQFPKTASSLEIMVARKMNFAVGTLFWNRRLPTSAPYAPFDDIHHFKALHAEMRGLEQSKRLKSVDWRLLYRILK